MTRADTSLKIDGAIEAIRKGQYASFSAAAKAFKCDRTSIAKRMHGKTKNPTVVRSLHQYALSTSQEVLLMDRIDYLTNRGICPTSSVVKSLAEELRGKPVGKNWVSQFTRRNKDRLASMYLRNIDNLRIGAEYPPAFEYFYDLYENTIEKYRVTAENIYNFDEKGFIIGFARTMKRIMSKASLDQGKNTKNRQDGSREFITCLACINALGQRIPPVLIYPGTSGDLWTSWTQDVTPEDEVFFAISSNGWSSHQLGLAWLKNVFQRYTKPVRATTKRLLLLDGHSSHINMAFVDWADRHGIIPLIFPPHTTHRLQPLDVGCFQPLSTAYSNELDTLMNTSGARISMTKVLFYPMFRTAWEASFTEKNIQSAWAKAGLWPCDRQSVISKITRLQKPENQSPTRPQTPKTAFELRAYQQSYIRSPSSAKRRHLFDCLNKLTAENSLLRIDLQGLEVSIELQKKKNKKARRLNLAGEESTGAECWSPAKVATARIYQEQLIEAEVVEIKEKEARKLQRAINKASKEAIKEQKQVAAQLRQDLRSTIMPKLKQPKRSQNTMRSPAKTMILASPKVIMPSKPLLVVSLTLPKASFSVAQEDKGHDGVELVGRQKRSIQLPQRFRI